LYHLSQDSRNGDFVASKASLDHLARFEEVDKANGYKELKVREEVNAAGMTPGCRIEMVGTPGFELEAFWRRLSRQPKS
jgi:hypothetical protein